MNNAMTMAAKFSGVCKACGGTIRAGEQIRWSKEAGARHATCGGAKSAAPAHPPPRRPSAPAKPRARKTPKAGEQIISRRSADKHDRYDVGQVVRIKDVDGFFVVVSEWKDAPCEDNGEYDWRASAIVRPATAEESAKRAAEIRCIEAPKLVAQYVADAVTAPGAEVFGDEAAAGLIPAGSEIWQPAEKSQARAHLHRVAVVGDSIVGYHGGYYDDYRATAWRVPASEKLLAAVRALISGNADALAVAADMAQESK